ncbi:MAG: glycosyltransferase, partial [Prochlorotrichaceae cyanobacterium]
KDKLQVIYNPVVDDRIEDQAALPIQHPWFKPGEPPVFLAVGRLSKQKDYPTLLQAFAKVCCTHKIRLLILGEGELRKQLQDLIKELKVEESVNMLGFVSNPYLYMAHATALVLSSVWEVLPTVLIEALACGCSVISTDCDYGPREILDEERYGKLVPVGDVNALAEAMLNALTQLPDRQRLKTYAQKFSIKAATDLYIEILGL